MVVVAAVIARNGCILACQRSRDGKFPLKWEFPGGKIQAGETPQAALGRELSEELGVDAKIGEEIYRTQHRYSEMQEPVELFFYEARIESGEMQNRIFQKVEWIEPEKLRELDFLEADRKFVEKLAAREIRM